MLGRNLQWIETSVCCSIGVYRGKTEASNRILWIHSDISIVYLYLCVTKFTYTYGQNFFLSVSFVPPSSLAFHSSQEVYFLKVLFKNTTWDLHWHFSKLKKDFHVNWIFETCSNMKKILLSHSGASKNLQWHYIMRLQDDLVHKIASQGF